MKLLCSESSMDICGDISRKLASAGIANDIQKRNPSLFDSDTNQLQNNLFEIWIANDEDLDRANSLLYPPDDIQADTSEEKD